jgi:hypothetical protein
MMNLRLQHDCSWLVTNSLMSLIEPMLRPEQSRIDAREEIDRLVRAGLEAFVTQSNRQAARLRPSPNGQAPGNASPETSEAGRVGP